jgi:Flp pilus assembly protein TadD
MGSLRYLVVAVVVVSLSGCASTAATRSAADDYDPLRIAREALDAGVVNEAEQRFRAHLADYPDDVDAMAGLGFALLDQQRHDAARAVFRQALERASDHREAREGAALVDLTRGQIDQARPVLLALSADGSASWRLWNGLGVMADLDGDPEAARRYYQLALEAGGDNAVVANNLGYSTMMAGDLPAAMRILSDASRRFPAELRLRHNLGLAQARAGRYDAALDTFSALMPAWEALNNVGYVAMLNDELPLARRYLLRALDASPRHYPQAAANLERVEAMIAVGRERSLQQ